MPKPAKTGSKARPIKPDWDKQWNEISVDGEVIERFKRRAPACEAILDAFQTDGWVLRIDDPLSPMPDRQESDRLRHQVQRLNRRLQSGMLHFYMDGGGTGVCWEWLKK